MQLNSCCFQNNFSGPKDRHCGRPSEGSVWSWPNLQTVSGVCSHPEQPNLQVPCPATLIFSPVIIMLQHNSGVWAEQSLEPLLLQLWLLHNKVDIYIIYWNSDSLKLTMFSGTRPLGSWRPGQRIWRILPGTMAMSPHCNAPIPHNLF